MAQVIVHQNGRTIKWTKNFWTLPLPTLERIRDNKSAFHIHWAQGQRISILTVFSLQLYKTVL